MRPKHPLFRIHVTILVALLITPPTVWSQRAPDIVVRRGADVQGTIDGAMQVLGEGEVDVSPGASIAGDVIVPPDKISGGMLPDDAKPSDRIKIKNRAGKAGLGGSVRAAVSYQPPAVVAPQRKRDPKSLEVIESYVLQKDISSATDFTIRNSQVRVQLPPNSYGDIVVEQGTLVLGFQGVTEVLRYDLQSLRVFPSARIEILCPVIVEVKEGLFLAGNVGNPGAVFWFDVRVAEGEVALNGDVYGHLNAPTSLVTLGESGKFTGGLVGDRVVVGPKAKIKAVSPNWTTGDRRELAEAHRALRLNREMPVLRARAKTRYMPGVSIIEDTAFVMLAATAGVDEGSTEEHALVLEAFHAALIDSGFQRAGVVLTSNREVSATPSVRNIILRKPEYERILRELIGRPSTTENVEAVRASTELCARFVTEAIAATRLGLAR